MGKSLSKEVGQEKLLSAIHAENALLKKKVALLLKEANAQDRIISYNKMSVDALEPVKYKPSYNKEDKETPESAVLVGSCWHIGETISRDEMGGMNEYNFEIFVRRFQYLIDKTIHNALKYTITELHLVLTGDMVSGIIHDELEASNELNIVEQATIGALVVAQGIQDLAANFPKVIVTCVVGNHGRTKQKKYFKHKQQVNWDYVFYTNLALMLKKQKNVSFNIPLSFWAGVQIQNSRFLVMHGDLVKSWGSIPFYGLNREEAKWVKIKSSQSDFFNYFVASHFHTKAVLQTPMGEQILNGSLKGGDEYAIGLGFYGDPIQLLFGVHPKYGKSWEVSINAKHADAKVRYKYNRSLHVAEQIGD